MPTPSSSTGLPSTLPPHPHITSDHSVDPKTGIAGNVSHKVKSGILDLLHKFTEPDGDIFCSKIGANFKIKAINAYRRSSGRSEASDNTNDIQGTSLDSNDDAITVETVMEIVVTKDMCNIHGGLHGGCTGYLVDLSTNSALSANGLILGVDGTGVSQSMNMVWHRAALLGAKITLKSRTSYFHGRIRTAQCEIWDGDKLCATGTHSTIRNDPRPKKQSKL